MGVGVDGSCECTEQPGLHVPCSAVAMLVFLFAMPSPLSATFQMAVSYLATFRWP